MKNKLSSKKVIAAVFILCGIPFTNLTLSGQNTNRPNLPDPGKAYIIQLTTKTAPALPANYNELSRYNFFGICWEGKVDDNLKYAKQMGYTNILYKPGMENSSLATDLNFYFESPEYQVYNSLDIDRQLRIAKPYTKAQKNTYQSFFALKITNDTFPGNMATGWRGSGSFSVEPDLQQQRVIDYFISHITEAASKTERPDKKFLFGGLTWDVCDFRGDFYGEKGVGACTLAHWNGKDSAALFPGTTHEYKTYSEARAAYYLKIRESLKAQFPGRRLTYVVEPYHFYDDWFKYLETLKHDDQVKIMDGTLVTEEAGNTKWSNGTDFVDDSRVFRTGIIGKNQVGSTTPDNHTLADNKAIAGKAALNGAWFDWYGRFSGSGDNIPMRNIYDVPNWLQLIRVVANWDNLNGVPLSERNLKGNNDYFSTNSKIEDNVIYSRQPKTQKLFVVFLNDKGEITLNPGEKIVSVKRVDKFFQETEDAKGDLKVTSNKIKLTSR